jgi:hypothetical protein
MRETPVHRPPMDDAANTATATDPEVSAEVLRQLRS